MSNLERPCRWSNSIWRINQPLVLCFWGFTLLCGCAETKNEFGELSKIKQMSDDDVIKRVPGVEANQTDSETKSTQATKMYDGMTLDGWQVTNFGGEGECYVENGNLVVEAGYPMSGVTYTKQLPKTNYEISLDAMKVSGEDFFCGITFPVNDSFCTFIAGGWGGMVTGLSCIDDQDASENATRKLKNFDSDKWYSVRLSVEPERIRVWVDNEKMVDQKLAGHKISLRNETWPSRPFGLCNYQTTSQFRNIRLSKLDSSGSED